MRNRAEKREDLAVIRLFAQLEDPELLAVLDRYLLAKADYLNRKMKWVRQTDRKNAGVYRKLLQDIRDVRDRLNRRQSVLTEQNHLAMTVGRNLKRYVEQCDPDLTELLRDSYLSQEESPPPPPRKMLAEDVEDLIHLTMLTKMGLQMLTRPEESDEVVTG